VFRKAVQEPPALKSVFQIAKMREAGKLVAKALRMCREMAKPGVRTAEINQAVEDFYRTKGAIPLFKDYNPGDSGPPFPAVTCLSLNEQVVHGIPGPRVLRDGDLLKIDTACKLEGWCADAAVTVPIGKVRSERLRLVKVAEEILDIAISEVGKRRWWSEVAGKMARHARDAGFSVVENYVGHGIGQEMHENPQVPNYVTKDLQRRGDFRIEPGLVLAIEPMLNMGRLDVDLHRDQWTVVTKDGLPSVHVEHTVAITPTGVVLLTVDDGDPRGDVQLS
jgi:methionyl aminopeptidase